MLNKKNVLQLAICAAALSYSPTASALATYEGKFFGVKDNNDQKVTGYTDNSTPSALWKQQLTMQVGEAVRDQNNEISGVNLYSYTNAKQSGAKTLQWFIDNALHGGDALYAILGSAQGCDTRLTKNCPQKKKNLKAASYADGLFPNFGEPETDGWVVASFYGVVDEYNQSPTPGRGSVADDRADNNRVNKRHACWAMMDACKKGQFTFVTYPDTYFSQYSSQTQTVKTLVDASLTAYDVNSANTSKSLSNLGGFAKRKTCAKFCSNIIDVVSDVPVYQFMNKTCSVAGVPAEVSNQWDIDTANTCYKKCIAAVDPANVSTTGNPCGM